MSDAAQEPGGLDIREHIARIDRTLAEHGKVQAEHGKLQAERDKLQAERETLTAEAGKLRRDRFLAPVLAAGAIAGAVAVIVPILLRSGGIH